MSTLFSDDFNRANSSALGANWDELLGNAQILGNVIEVDDFSAGLGPGVVVTSASAHAATADVKVTVTQKSATGDGGPVARCTSGVGAVPTMYALDSYPNILELYRHNAAHSGTLLATGIANTTGANGVLGLELSGTGATVTVKSYLNGVLKQTVADSNASRITAAGRTGIYQWILANGAQQDYDDFLVEDLGVAAAADWLPRRGSFGQDARLRR